MLMISLKKYADLPIRFVVGFHLIYGTQDNVFSWGRMLEFKDFLEHFGMPFPLLSAMVSVYSQFICGVLFIVGYHVKIAGLIMLFNFFVAIILVHLSDPYRAVYPAISMISGALFLVMNGSGAISIDQLIRNKKSS